MTNAINLRAMNPPPKLVEMLGQRGSRNVRCFHAMNGDRSVSVIVSDDPSGDDGAFESHVSISIAPNAGGNHYPTDSEIESAKSVANADSKRLRQSQFVNRVLHLWFSMDDARINH